MLLYKCTCCNDSIQAAKARLTCTTCSPPLTLCANCYVVQEYPQQHEDGSPHSISVYIQSGYLPVPPPPPVRNQSVRGAYTSAPARRRPVSMNYTEAPPRKPPRPTAPETRNENDPPRQTGDFSRPAVPEYPRPETRNDTGPPHQTGPPYKSEADFSRPTGPEYPRPETRSDTSPPHQTVPEYPRPTVPETRNNTGPPHQTSPPYRNEADFPRPTGPEYPRPETRNNTSPPHQTGPPYRHEADFSHPTVPEYPRPETRHETGPPHQASPPFRNEANPPHPPAPETRKETDEVPRTFSQTPNPQQSQATGWTPFFNPDMTPSPSFTRLIDEFFRHLDPHRTGYLSPEAFSDYIDTCGAPPNHNIWKASRAKNPHLGYDIADRELTDHFTSYSVDFALRPRTPPANPPSVLQKASFSFLPASQRESLNQILSNCTMPSLSGGQKPMLSHRGWTDLTICSVLLNPSSAWGQLNRAMRQYRLPVWTEWGDIPRDMLPLAPYQPEVDRVRVMMEGARLNAAQELNAVHARLKLEQQGQQNALDLLDDRVWVYR